MDNVPYRLVLGALERIEDSTYVNDNGYRISEKVRNCDAETLRKIAALIGYKPPSRPQKEG